MAGDDRIRRDRQAIAADRDGFATRVGEALVITSDGLAVTPELAALAIHGVDARLQIDGTGSNK